MKNHLNKKNINIYLASPRGFCAGVERAINMVEKALKKYGAPVYVRHEIVHNKYVVEDLKKMGAIFIEELDEIKDQSRPVIFSAHGVPKSIPKYASLKKSSMRQLRLTVCSSIPPYAPAKRENTRCSSAV